MAYFPPRIPHKDINTNDFEAGFDEKYIVGPLPCNSLICSCCFGIPRHPITLNTCGHMFCESCILINLEKSPGARTHNNGRRSVPCPICRKRYSQENILLFKYFQFWAQNIYNQIVVKCPHDCGFSGTPESVDDHQVYECAQRPICCPFPGCTFVGEAHAVAKEHFQACKERRYYCAKCQLPCQATPENPHDCVFELQEALRSTINRCLPPPRKLHPL